MKLKIILATIIWACSAQFFTLKARPQQCQIKDFPFSTKVVFELAGAYRTSLAARHLRRAILNTDVGFVAGEVGTVTFNFKVRCGENADVVSVDVIPNPEKFERIPSIFGFEKPETLDGTHLEKDTTCKAGTKGKLITLSAAASHQSVSPVTVEKEAGVIKFSKEFGTEGELEAGYIGTWEICCCCRERESDYSFTSHNGPYYAGRNRVDYSGSAIISWMMIKIKEEPKAKQCQ